jgi:hypothetical protein
MRTHLVARRILAAAALLAGLAVTCAAFAAIPQRISYQGFLTSAGNVPTNASLQMVFRLFDVPTGGAALWSETQTVAVTNGLYNVSLGAATPLALPALPFDAPYYLEITVGGELMSARQPLASAPYAFRAGCIPGDRVTCFSAGATVGPGCSTGTRVCNDDGLGWSACAGEIAPNCASSCVNLQTDITNCGACGTACPSAANSSRMCSAGNCGITCNAGFSDCNSNAADGCETNIATSVNNCGACGVVCSAANGNASCNAGACVISACNAGFSNCNNNAADGCETNIATSVNNCGACGAVCGAANGTASCNAGACGITCNPGFANCNGNVADGCEINLTNNASHCGACGSVCAVNQSCVNSACI